MVQNTLYDIKVLAIDDDPVICQALKTLLSRHGADVCTAADGRTGLQQLMACQPNIVLLDILMPGIDGWETFRRIRQISDVPVIFLTVLGRSKEIVKGLNLLKILAIFL